MKHMQQYVFVCLIGIKWWRND